MSKKVISGIYKITNLSNGKIYVGSAVDVFHRWCCHKGELKENKHSNQYLQNAWNKYKENNFIFEIIEELKDKSKIIEREQYWIDKTKCFKRSVGYNLSPTAGSQLGYKHTKETKKRIGESKKGCIPWNKGRVGLYSLSEETKKKISENNKGEGNPFSKLTWKKINEIRKIYKTSSLKMGEIAKIYNLSLSHTTSIINNKTWKDENYNPPKGYEKSNKRSQSKLDIKLVNEIRRKYSTNNYSQSRLANEYDVSRATVQAVVNGRSWKEEGFEKINREFKQVPWNKGIPHSKETRKKMSDNHADVSGEKHPMYGKTHTEEAKIKIRESRSKQIFSEEIQKKKSEKLKGNNNAKRKLTWSDVKEIREKFNQGYTKYRLAKKFNISFSNVFKIVNNLTWKLPTTNSQTTNLLTIKKTP